MRARARACLLSRTRPCGRVCQVFVLWTLSVKRHELAFTLLVRTSVAEGELAVSLTFGSFALFFTVHRDGWRLSARICFDSGDLDEEPDVYGLFTV